MKNTSVMMPVVVSLENATRLTMSMEIVGPTRGMKANIATTTARASDSEPSPTALRKTKADPVASRTTVNRPDM